MSTFFKAIRYSLAFILSIILFITALIGIQLFSISNTLSNKENVKEIIVKSEVTQGLADKSINAALINTKDNPELQKLLEESKNPSTDTGKLRKLLLNQKFVDTTVDTLINSLYDWFDGKTTKPEFNIKVVESKEEMMELLSAAFKIKYESLPVCNTEEIKAINIREYNPMEAKCKLPNVSSQVVDEYIQANQNTPEFQELYSKTSFNSDNINIDRQITDKVQLVYKVSRYLSIILLILVLILAALIILLVYKKSNGIRLVSIIIGIASILNLVIAAIANANYDRTIKEIFLQVPEQNRDIAYSISSNLIKELFLSINQIQIILSILTLVMTITLFGISFIRRSNNIKSIEITRRT